jgi:excisionase family DNA binding protein
VESPPPTPGEPSQPRAGGDALDLLNINEIAAALRVSRMTVYRLIRDGRLPAFRVGKSLRVHRRDLAAYLDAAHRAPPYNRSAVAPESPAPPDDPDSGSPDGPGPEQ